ncbi:MAG: anthrone oxygenase family protein [Pseudomonadota bacterium]
MSFTFLVFSQFAALALALVGGVFLAFSDFIMRSLSKTSGAGGIEAMQVINREVFRWIFMTLFLGLAALSALLVAYGLIATDGSTRMLLSAAGLAYLLGCFGVTVFFNVPMNEALAKMDLGAAETQVYWVETYLPGWTGWNTFRAIACIISAAFLMGLPLVAQ